MRLTDPKMLEKYASHVAACRRNGIEPMTMAAFKSDVLAVPEATREFVLQIDVIEPFVPIKHYDQYDAPSKLTDKTATSV